MTIHVSIPRRGCRYGYARKTGSTGVATVTQARADAVDDRPSGGGAGTHPARRHRRRGVADKGMVQSGSHGALCRGHRGVLCPAVPATLATGIRDAFLQAGPKWPVVVGILDLAERARGCACPAGTVRHADAARIAAPAGRGELAAARRMIADARRIIVMGGLGAVAAGAGLACAALRQAGQLLATTLPARGMFQSLQLGVAGGFSSEIARERSADPGIAVGGSLASHNSIPGAGRMPLLQIDIAPPPWSRDGAPPTPPQGPTQGSASRR